ncbi:MAG: hypothetical protein V4603_05225, partial [Pseudomonadota bacterium]
MTTETQPPVTEMFVTPVNVSVDPPKKSRVNPRFTFEAILIVLSVLLGFGVSEWRQAQVDEELAEQVQLNLRTELEYNIGQLEATLPRQRQLYELVKSADLSNSEQSGWDIIFAALGQVGSGFGKPSLRRGAWDAAVSTGALRLLDYKVVAGLSEVYAAQDALNTYYAETLSAYQTDTFRSGLQRETVQVFR